MNRYFSSFFLTLLLYASVVAGFIYTVETFKQIDDKPIKKHKQVIKFAMITIKKKIEPEPVIEKKPEPKPIIEEKVEPIIEKKPEPKPIVKPKPKIVKKPKKIIKKKKIVKKKIVKKKVVKPKPIIKKEPKIVEKQVVQKAVNPSVQFRQLNFSKIRKLINDQVKYPRMARKLGKQGRVTVQFLLQKNGTVLDLVILSGAKIFKKSTFKAIRKASKNFPKPSKDITLKLTIEYVLK